MQGPLHSRQQRSAARCRGVMPFASRAITSAPAANNASTVSIPVVPALCSGVRPYEPRARTSAPAANKVSTFARVLAWCSGVQPVLSRAITSAPAANNASTLPASPRETARWRGVWPPYSVRAITSAPVAKRTSTTARPPSRPAAACKIVLPSLSRSRAIGSAPASRHAVTLSTLRSAARHSTHAAMPDWSCGVATSAEVPRRTATMAKTMFLIVCAPARFMGACGLFAVALPVPCRRSGRRDP